MHTFRKRLSYLFQQFRRHFRRHPLIARLAWVQVIAGIVFGQEEIRVRRVTQGAVKVNAAVNQLGHTDEIIVSVAQVRRKGASVRQPPMGSSVPT